MLAQCVQYGVMASQAELMDKFGLKYLRISTQIQRQRHLRDLCNEKHIYVCMYVYIFSTRLLEQHSFGGLAFCCIRQKNKTRISHRCLRFCTFGWHNNASDGRKIMCLSSSNSLIFILITEELVISSHQKTFHFDSVYIQIEKEPFSKP